MSQAVWIECPKCSARLKLRNRNHVGKKVPCPKCNVPFRIQVPPESEAELEAFDDYGAFDEEASDEYASNEALPAHRDDESDEYESRSTSARGKKKAEPKPKTWIMPVVVTVCVLATIGAVAGIIMFSGGGGSEQPRLAETSPAAEAATAEAAPQSEAPAAAATAEPAQAAPAAGNGNPPQQAAAQKKAEKDEDEEDKIAMGGVAMGPAGQGAGQADAARREAIARRLREKNPEALKKAIQKDREQKTNELKDKKWSPEDIEKHLAEKKFGRDWTPSSDGAQTLSAGETTAPAESPATTPTPDAQSSVAQSEPIPSEPMPSAPVTTESVTANTNSQPTEGELAADPEEAALDAIKGLGGRTDKNSSGRISSVTLTNISSLSDDDLEHLTAFAELEKLDLSRSPVTDEGLAIVGQLTQLKGLNLAETSITNEGLEHLAGLQNLEALGLQSTRVTNAGVRHLTALQNLKNLFLAQTKITQAGLGKLKRDLPDCTVEFEASKPGGR